MKPIKILTAFLLAYEAKDIDAIAAILSDDVTLQDWNLVASGKEAVLAETRKNFLDADALQIEIRQIYGGEGCAAARLRIKVNHMNELEVVDTININSNGQVCSIRAYKG